MENEPDTTNVHYLDEYPHLERKLELKRSLGQLTLFGPTQLLLFPTDPEATPDLEPPTPA